MTPDAGRRGFFFARRRHRYLQPGLGKTLYLKGYRPQRRADSDIRGRRPFSVICCTSLESRRCAVPHRRHTQGFADAGGPGPHPGLARIPQLYPELYADRTHGIGRARAAGNGLVASVQIFDIGLIIVDSIGVRFLPASDVDPDIALHPDQVGQPATITLQ